MRLYAVLFALLLTFLSPMQLNSAGGNENCFYQDLMEIKLYEEEQCRIAQEKAKLDSLEQYTSFGKNLQFLGTMGVDFDRYARIMALKESPNGNYKVVNQFGYMGRYQFGKRTLKGLKRTGYLNFEKHEINQLNFLNNKVLQEAAMCALTAHNTEILERYGVLGYVGTEIGGVKITIEGLLAGSHLRGPHAVKRFLLTNGRVNKVDGNGTSVRDYISAFA